MQTNTISPALLAKLQANEIFPRALIMVVEFYKSSAVPTSAGFDPQSVDFLFGAGKTAGFVFRTKTYKQQVLRLGDINRTIRKELSTFSFTLSNASRELVDFEIATGFEGLICVARLVDRRLTDNLADSIVLFTGRCEKPDTFDRSSESASILVKQILSGIEINIPRRKFTPDDMEGRSPSDPLFEGFRYQQRNGSVNFTEVVKKRFLLFFTRKKTVTRTLQYSTHSDIESDTVVPLALGRVQMQALQLAYYDAGTVIAGTAAFCEGEIAAYVNLRPVTPGFTFTGLGLYKGKLGGTGDQLLDDPTWIGAAIYSRTAYIRYNAAGSQIDVDDPAPQIVSVILGMKVPLPAANGLFTLSDWTDNPVYLSRWLLNSPDFFNLEGGWFDDLEFLEEASYCDQILVDQSSTDTVVLNSSQSGVAGVGYQNYASTGRISPSYWRRISGESGYEDAYRGADYEFYSGAPGEIYGDWNGDGVVDFTTPPTNYRRRYTANVLLSEQMKAIEFLYDILFPAFNGYLVQKASGKLAVRVARPAAFAFVKAANTVGATEILIKNINPFRNTATVSKILIGAHLPTSELRSITGARYDTTVQIAVAASGGITTSSATLTGGSATLAPSATITATAVAGTKTLTIDGYVLTYTPEAATDTTYTIAAILAALINSHNELNKYIKAVWQTGSPNFTIESRAGYLDLNLPLDFVHSAGRANPTAAPAVANTSGNLISGTYKVAYSFVTATGETLTSPSTDHVTGTGGGVYLYPIAMPAGVTGIRWYASIEPNGRVLKLVFENNGAGWIYASVPPRDAASEPVVNATAEECHAIALAFSDKASVQTDNTRSNMLKGSFKFPLGSKQPSTNRIDIKYRDSAQDFQLTELRVKDRAHIAKVKKVNPKEINGAAIDNYHQARRIANQKLAVDRDGDFFYTFTADNEALLLEEGDVISVTDASGRFVNETVRVEEITISDGDGFPQISITGRKYRRAYYDDQITERLAPLAIINNTDVNTEQQAPGIWQYSAATNTTVQIGVNNYTDGAKYRKVEMSATANMATPTVFIIAAAEFANNLLPAIQTVTKTSEAAAVTKYFRFSHSSNNVSFGAVSNVLGIIFADSGGTGGTGGGGTGGGGGIGGSGDPNGECFAGDTLVTMADGKQVSLQEIYKRREFYIGTHVKSYNQTGAIVAGEITQVFKHEVEEYLRVQFANDTSIYVTAEHPFLTRSGKYKAIGNLEIGTVIQTDTEPGLTIITAKQKFYPSPGTTFNVYNLHVLEYQNYVADGMRVHNLKQITF